MINRALVPDNIYERVMTERMAIINGKNIFAEPLKNDRGIEMVAKGKTLSVNEVSKTTWHVEGVVTPEVPLPPVN